MPRLLAPLALLIALPATAQIVAPATPPAANPYLHDETRADAEAKAAEVFRAMDADHDGFVTVEEVAAFIAAHSPSARDGAVPPPSAMAKDMIADADTDKDGRVSAEESKAAADHGFDEADTNHDGVVTPDERMAAMRGDDAPPPPAAPTPVVKGKPADSPR